MFRGQNEGKKILSNKWNEYNKQIHYQKLRNIKGQVDTGCPATFGTLKRKPKKEQIMEDRFTEIERENRILLEKMSHIVNAKQNRSSSTNRRKSLNTAARKRQNLQIVVENQALLKRLQEKQPSYSVYKWEEERKSTEKRLRNICEFPYTLGGHEETPRKSTEFRTRQNSRSRKIIRVPESASNNQRKLSPITKRKAQTVYKKGMSLGDKHFIIEIQKKPDTIIILAFDVESPESFCLELPYNEALQLMGRNENYNVLAGMLGVEDGELVLIENKFGFEGSGTQRVGKSDRKIGHDEFVVESGNMFHKKNNSFSGVARSVPQDFAKNEFDRIGNQDELENYFENDDMGRVKKNDDEEDDDEEDEEDDEEEKDLHMDKMKSNEDKYMEDEDYDDFEQEENSDEKIEDKDDDDLRKRGNNSEGFHDKKGFDEDLHRGESKKSLKLESEGSEKGKKADYQESEDQEKIEKNSQKTEESGISKKSSKNQMGTKDDMLLNKDKNEDSLVKSEPPNDIENIIEKKQEVLDKNESHKSIEKYQSEKSLKSSASKVSDKIADKQISQKASEKSIKSSKELVKTPPEPHDTSEKLKNTLTDIENDPKNENKIDKFSEISDPDFSGPFDPKPKAESPQAESDKSEEFVPATKNEDPINEPETHEIIEEKPSKQNEVKIKTLLEKSKTVNEKHTVDIFSGEEKKSHLLKKFESSSEENFEADKKNDPIFGVFKSENEENIKVEAKGEEEKYDDKNVEHEGKNNEEEVLETGSKHFSRKSLTQHEENVLPHKESNKSLHQAPQSYHSSKKSLKSYKDEGLDNVPNENLTEKKGSFKEEKVDFGHSGSNHSFKSEKNQPAAIHKDKEININDEKAGDNIPISKSDSKTSIKKLVVDENEENHKVDLGNDKAMHEDKNVENAIKSKEENFVSHEVVHKNEKELTDDNHEEKNIEHKEEIIEKNVGDHEKIDEFIKKESDLHHEEAPQLVDKVKNHESHDEKEEKLQAHDEDHSIEFHKEKTQDCYEEKAYVEEEKTVLQPYKELSSMNENEKSDEEDQSKPHISYDEKNNEHIEDKIDENDEKFQDSSENKVPEIENVILPVQSEEITKEINEDIHEKPVDKPLELVEVLSNEEPHEKTEDKPLEQVEKPHEKTEDKPLEQTEVLSNEELHEKTEDKPLEQTEVPSNEKLHENLTETKNETVPDHHEPHKSETIEHLKEEPQDEDSSIPIKKPHIISEKSPEEEKQIPDPNPSDLQRNLLEKTDNPDNLVDPEKLIPEGRTESLFDQSALGPIPEVVISMAEDPVNPPYTLIHEEPSENPKNPHENTEHPSS